MEIYSIELLNSALIEVDKTLNKCEKIFPKFDKGTSQHTLLINRMNALAISKQLIEDKISNHQKSISLTKKELEQALKPIDSIIHKCSQAQSKYDINTFQFKRYNSLLDSMKICKSLIEKELSI